MANYRDQDPPEIETDQHRAAIDPRLCFGCGQIISDPLEGKLCMPALDRSTGGEVPGTCPRGFGKFDRKDRQLRQALKGGTRNQERSKPKKQKKEPRREGNVTFI